MVMIILKVVYYMNIEFDKDNNRFSARASAIIYNSDKTKVLLFKVEDGRDYFLLPGGRIEFNEDSKSAIKREIKEELDYDIDFKSCSIQENFIKHNDTITTQYCFVYKGIYNGVINDDKIECCDHDNQSFYWINIDEINNYKILPMSLMEDICNDTTYIKHYVESINL